MGKQVKLRSQTITSDQLPDKLPLTGAYAKTCTQRQHREAQQEHLNTDIEIDQINTSKFVM